MPLRLSLAVHMLLLFCCGCAAHRPIGSLRSDALVREAKGYVVDVKSRMPLWDADYVGQFEREEIARVKADIFAAQMAPTRLALLEAAARLHRDFDSLRALDERLKVHAVL